MTEAAPLIAPQHLTAEDQSRWLENTERFGDPVYLRPFWFWPDSDTKEHRTYCHPLSLWGNARDFHACSVWTKTAPGEKLFTYAPVFLEDLRGPKIDPSEDIEDLNLPSGVIDIDDLPVEVREVRVLSETRAQAINRYSLLLFGVVAATAVGVGLVIQRHRK